MVMNIKFYNGIIMLHFMYILLFITFDFNYLYFGIQTFFSGDEHVCRY